MSNERETDTDTLFIVKATDPYTKREYGDGSVALATERQLVNAIQMTGR